MTGQASPKGEKGTQQSPQIAQLLYNIHSLSLNAFLAKNRKTLIFQIVNDLVHAIHYDRAVLWDMEGATPKVIGISGIPRIPKTSDLLVTLQKQLKNIKDLSTVQTFSVDTEIREPNQETPKVTRITVIWLPINYEGKLHLGLWLEIWKDPKDLTISQDLLKLINDALLPAYGAAWVKLIPYFRWRRFAFNNRNLFLGSILTLFLLFGVRIALRIVAPCEVVPRDPYLITAQVEGIIEQILAKPGSHAKAGDILVEYDKRAAQEELRAQQQQVQVLESSVNRASTLGLRNEQSRSEYSILIHKLEKEKAGLELAKYRASKLTIAAPISGYAIIDNPDEWRGKPVKVGEKILMLADQTKTKIKIWIPENDNIVFDPEKNVRIFLNINPMKSHEAKLTYVPAEATLSPKQVSSFAAEAEWIGEQPPEAKLGAKGTAVLYGERVTIAYWIMRRPIAYVRNFLGI